MEIICSLTSSTSAGTIYEFWFQLETFYGAVKCLLQRTPRLCRAFISIDILKWFLAHVIYSPYMYLNILSKGCDAHFRNNLSSVRQPRETPQPKIYDCNNHNPIPKSSLSNLIPCSLVDIKKSVSKNRFKMIILQDTMDANNVNILAQVMAWCSQATSHYLSQCRSIFVTIWRH